VAKFDSAIAIAGAAVMLEERLAVVAASLDQRLDHPPVNLPQRRGIDRKNALIDLDQRPSSRVNVASDW